MASNNAGQKKGLWIGLAVVAIVIVIVLAVVLGQKGKAPQPGSTDEPITEAETETTEVLTTEALTTEVSTTEVTTEEETFAETSYEDEGDAKPLSAEGLPASLRTAIETASKQKVLGAVTMDFNHDGTKEAFAVCGELSDNEYGNESYVKNCQFWFSDGRLTKCVDDNASDDFKTPVYFIEPMRLSHNAAYYGFLVGFGPGHENYSVYYIDRNGQPFEALRGVDCKPYLVEENMGDWIQTYCFYSMPGGSRYNYFRFDPDKQAIVELGGLEITEDALRRVPGTEDAFAKLRKDHAEIDSIYYRENGIVNINYNHGDELVSINVNNPLEKLSAQECITLLIKDGKAKMIDVQENAEKRGWVFYDINSGAMSDEEPAWEISTPSAFPY